MIGAPYPIAPQPGPPAAPSERDLAAVHPEPREHALTVAWTAEVLGRQARPGYSVAARQLLPAGRGPQPDLSTVAAAAAGAGWTSLELHRFMTTPLEADGATPAALLGVGDAARVAEPILGGPAGGRR